MQATVTDANGNPVEGVSVAFSADNGATIAATGTSDANGEVVQTLTSTTVGTSTVTATVNGVSRSREVVFGLVAVLTVQVPDVVDNDTVVGTVQARTAGGTPMPGLRIQLTSATATVLDEVVTDEGGNVEFTVTDMAVGANQVTATARGALDAAGTGSRRDNLVFSSLVCSLGPAARHVTFSVTVTSAFDGSPVQGFSLRYRIQTSDGWNWLNGAGQSDGSGLSERIIEVTTGRVEPGMVTVFSSAESTWDGNVGRLADRYILPTASITSQCTAN
ncbi:Ig-like domain-containing protein [Aeromonas caviae]